MRPVLLLCTEMVSEPDLVCSVPVSARVDRGDGAVQQFRFAWVPRKGSESSGREGGHRFPLVHCSHGTHPEPERWLM